MPLTRQKPATKKPSHTTNRMGLMRRRQTETRHHRPNQPQLWLARTSRPRRTSRASQATA
eukprot:4404990-Prorocentrum_lima.AAC.1